MDDQIIKLVYQSDTAAVDRAKRETQGLHGEVGKLANTYDVLGKDVSIADAALDAWTREAVEATRTAKNLAAMMDEAAEATAGAKGAAASSSSGGMVGASNRLNNTVNQLAFGFGDIAQSTGDFSQRLRGASNNLQVVLMQFGAWGIAAGVATSALIALYEVWDKSTESSDELSDSLDKQKTKTDALADSVKKLKDLQSPVAGAEGKERVELLAGLGGQQDALVRAVETTLPRTNIDLLEQARDAVQQELEAARARPLSGFGPDGGQASRMVELREIGERLGEVTSKLNEAISGRQGMASQIVAGAMVQGDIGAFNTIRQMMADRPDRFSAEQRLTFEQASPKAVAEDAEFERGNEAAAQRGKDRREKEKESDEKHAANLKLTLELEEMRKKRNEEIAKMNDRFAEQDRKAVEKRTGAVVDVLGQGDIDERAEIRAAQLRGTGQAVDRFGRARRLTPEQQTERLRQEIEQEIARGQPGMDPRSRADVSGQMAREAMGTVDAMLGAFRQQAASGGIVDRVQQQQAAMASVMEVLIMNQQKALTQGARIQQMTNQLQMLAEKVGVGIDVLDTRTSASARSLQRRGGR